MKLNLNHPWTISYQEARRLQQKLRDKLDCQSPLSPGQIHRIAAADISYDRHESMMFGVVVLAKFPSLIIEKIFYSRKDVSFPYIPGLLSFRELPVLAQIFEQMSPEWDFDVILCDAHGFAHPRRFGLASHLGVLLDKPSIGCAKSRLTGHFEEPPPLKGEHSFLYEDSEIIGAVLRTRNHVKPVFISVGHKINLHSAIEISLACTTRFRIPEPLRIAHMEVNRYRSEFKDEAGA